MIREFNNKCWRSVGACACVCVCVCGIVVAFWFRCNSTCRFLNMCTKYFLGVCMLNLQMPGNSFLSFSFHRESQERHTNMTIRVQTQWVNGI